MFGYISLLAMSFGLIGLAQSLPAYLDGGPVDRVWQIPQKDGSFRGMTENEAEEEALIYEPQVLSSKKFDKVRFFLYTPDNPIEPVEINKDDLESLGRSTFNFKNPTRFMIHGWNSGYNSSEAQLIRKALLIQGEHDRKFNFFAVDWTVYAQSNLYVSSQKSISKAGKIVADFIDWLHDNAKLSFDTLALYGHSLGAHVVGFAGKNVRLGKVHTIIGLDPAMPLFNYDNPKGRLAETDAKYVESIHTNGGVLGFYHPIGRASFYPNGGRTQPGCGLDVGCAHGRAVEFLAEALASPGKNGFLALKCKDFDDIKNASCTNSKNSIVVSMGHSSNALYANGIYYLETNSQSPYGLYSKRIL